MAKRITQAAFARLCNVNRSTVNRWIKNGRIEADQQGRIDPDEALRLREDTESPLPHHQARKAQIEEQKAAQGQTAPEPTPEAQPGLHSLESIGRELKLETLRLQRAKRAMADMESERMAGNLLAREDVEYVLEDLGGALRSIMEGFADRYTGAVAAHQGDTAAIHRLLETAAHEVLHEVAGSMKRKMQEVSA